MFAKCSNSQCAAPFDYREGQLIRSCASQLDGQSAIAPYRVEHFWLCGCCSKLYVFEHNHGAGMKLRVKELQKASAVSFVKVA
jgi:hypothetical protein